MKSQDSSTDLNRREFLKNGSMASMMAMLGAVELKAQDAPTQYDTSKYPPVKLGVIGCGTWGREILATLVHVQNGPVVAVSDHYGAYLRRGNRIVPDAKPYENYKDLLADTNVEAVIVATPTHQHSQIVKDALKAGKHVYCEAPLSNSIEDAREIVAAVKAAPGKNFQVGLQARSDPQRHFLLDFIRTGSMGKNAFGRGQFHKKQSWRRVSPNPDRQREINWHLDKKSTGMIGEIGIHQVDTASWTYRGLPQAISGFGSKIDWSNDNLPVPNTIQALFEYEGGTNYAYDATFASSFDSDYEMYYGSDATIMIRGNSAWMFKEVDSPLLGWEVYARKDQFYQETGIALVMNATKLVAQGSDAADKGQVFKETPLYYALENFAKNCFAHQAAVEDFTALFGDDQDALKDYLKDTEAKKSPYCDLKTGYEAAVTVIKANEAILGGKRIEMKPEWYSLA